MAVNSPDLKLSLAATPFFGGISDASLDLLISMLIELRLERATAVIREGGTGRSMYVVYSGNLSATKRGALQNEIPVSTFGPGDFFGEMTLIEIQNRSATVVAKDDAVLYELTAKSLYTFYRADMPAYVMVLQNINRELCRRLRSADDRITQLIEIQRQ